MTLPAEAGRVPALIAGCRVLALFYPKFENEADAEEGMRQKILSALPEDAASKQAVLEVSIKHSGSLFMWAGEDGSFSKNATGNLVSATGLFILSRTLALAWGGAAVGERVLKELSKFLAEERLTLSMELVTAVLGDHGQACKKDYCVVTAIGRRCRALSPDTFFSTREVLEFCRRWRLPHNDYWLFNSRQSAEAFFAFYDTAAEAGTTSEVVSILCDLADVHVSGTHPHAAFQGQILEGLVARVVPASQVEELVHSPSTPAPPRNHGRAGHLADSDTAHDLRAMWATYTGLGDDGLVCISESALIQELLAKAGFSAESHLLQRLGPPKATSKPSMPATAAGPSGNSSKRKRDQGTSHQDGTQPAPSRNGKRKSNQPKRYKRPNDSWGGRLSKRLKGWLGGWVSDFFPRFGSNSRAGGGRAKAPVRKVYQLEEEVLKDFLAALPGDDQTKAVQELVQITKKLKIPTAFKFYRRGLEQAEVVPAAGLAASRFVMAVQVLDDSAFRRYAVAQQQHRGLLLPLYRGFFLELTLQPTPAASARAATEEGQGRAAEEAPVAGRQHLMLKLKFLPYKLRTFILRNGRSVFLRDGLPAYRHYYLRLLESWGVSAQKRKELVPLCEAWAVHISEVGATKGPAYREAMVANRAPYLCDAEPFLADFDHRREAQRLRAGRAAHGTLVSEAPVEAAAGPRDSLVQAGGAVGQLEEPEGVGFSGVCLLLAPTARLAQGLANVLCRKLNCFSAGLKDLTSASFPLLSQQGTIVPVAMAEVGFPRLQRTFLEDHQSALLCLRAWLQDPHLAIMTASLSEPERKKAAGVTEGWERNLKLLPKLEVLDCSPPVSGDSLVPTWPASPVEQQTVQQLAIHLAAAAKAKAPAPAAAQGVLVFFPGIPGIGKTTVASTFRAQRCPEGKFAGRDVLIMQGDAIKGKFWQAVGSERALHPGSLLIADKNAVGRAALAQVAALCLASNAQPVCVVPRSQGTLSNPFCLATLAVCLQRVLARHNHPGALGKDTKDAAKVVLDLYTLYEGQDRVEFEVQLRKRFGAHSLVELPLLLEGAPALPPALEALLQQAIEHVGPKEGRRGRKVGHFWRQWEAEVRTEVAAHEALLRQMQVPLEVVVEALSEGLEAQLGKVAAAAAPLENAYLACVELLTAPLTEHLCQALQVAGGQVAAQVLALLASGVVDAHVTVVHVGSHGRAALERAATLAGSTVHLSATALLVAEEVAALQVTIQDAVVRTVCCSEWPHVTLWMAPAVEAKVANELPGWLTTGKAQQLLLPHPIALQGTLVVRSGAAPGSGAASPSGSNQATQAVL